MICKFRIIIVILTFLLILVLIVKSLENVLTQNISISEPTGYYLTLPIFSKIKRNNKYLICLNNNKYLALLEKLGLPHNVDYECPLGFPYLIKQVAGIPGDKIKVTLDGILINNQLQPNSKAFIQARGINLYPLPLNYQITLNQDEYFVLGITTHSVDSRYFGIIKKDQFYKQAILIFRKNKS